MSLAAAALLSLGTLLLAPTATADLDPREVVRAIVAERAALEARRPRPDPSGDEARVVTAATSVWQRLSNWWARLFSDEDDDPHWFGEWIRGIFEPIVTFLGALPWRAFGFLLLVGIAAWLLHKGLKALRGPVAPIGGGPAFPEGSVVGDALRHDAAHFLGEGRALLERGDARGAVRSFYTGLLSALHRRRFLDLDPARTNWEHVERLAGRRALHERLVPCTRTFDDAWYGRQRIEADRALEIARVLEEVAAP